MEALVKDFCSSIDLNSYTCSVCLDPLLDQSSPRATAKLLCGHEFHLTCISSAFNAKGAMQCPYCRNIDNEKWHQSPSVEPIGLDDVNAADDGRENPSDEYSDDEIYEPEMPQHAQQITTNSPSITLHDRRHEPIPFNWSSPPVATGWTSERQETEWTIHDPNPGRREGEYQEFTFDVNDQNLNTNSRRRLVGGLDAVEGLQVDGLLCRAYMYLVGSLLILSSGL